MRTAVSVPLAGVPEAGEIVAPIDVGLWVKEKAIVPVDADVQPEPLLTSAVAVMVCGCPTAFVALAGDRLIRASTHVLVAGDDVLLTVTPETVPLNDAVIDSVPGVVEVSVLVAMPLVAVVTVSVPLNTPLQLKTIDAPETPVQFTPSVVDCRVAVKV